MSHRDDVILTKWVNSALAANDLEGLQVALSSHYRPTVDLSKRPRLVQDPDWRAHWAPGNPIGEFVRCGVTATNYHGLKG